MPILSDLIGQAKPWEKGDTLNNKAAYRGELNTVHDNQYPELNLAHVPKVVDEHTLACLAKSCFGSAETSEWSSKTIPGTGYSGNPDEKGLMRGPRDPRMDIIGICSWTQLPLFLQAGAVSPRKSPNCIQIIFIFAYK